MSLLSFGIVAPSFGCVLVTAIGLAMGFGTRDHSTGVRTIDMTCVATRADQSQMITSGTTENSGCSTHCSSNADERWTNAVCRSIMK